MIRDLDPLGGPPKTHRVFWSQGLLLMSAFLAGVFYPAMVHLRANAIERTALSAFHIQPGLEAGWTVTENDDAIDVTWCRPRYFPTTIRGHC
jgi:hypothetical protein